MDKTALVGFEVENGAKILRILDEAGLQIKVALWAFLGEYDEWRLVLSARKFDDGSLQHMAYFTRLWMPPISLWN